MKIGYIGAGKLGMPVAACVAQKHDVLMLDRDPEVFLRWGNYPFVESARGTDFETINALMNAMRGNVRFTLDVRDMKDRDIIFVSVQTPHAPEYEGITPVPAEPKDFDYSFLRAALVDLAAALKDSGRHHTVVVISTCLPGTYEREFRSSAETWDNINIVYNPYFIAMGTVIPDFLDPEFVLVGWEDFKGARHGVRAYGERDLRKFYEGFGLADRIRAMSITSAEATKVFYNTFISMKLSFANVVAEACERVGADCDSVMGAIKQATKRLISPAYLTPGMGDSGGCHPRDGIALSHFAAERGMSFDFFGMLMQQRQEQARYFARLMDDASDYRWLPLGIVGIAFKANTNIVTGSHAELVRHYAQKRSKEGVEVGVFDRFTNGKDPTERGVYLVGCAHDYIKSLQFPRGSIVLDPWGIVKDQDGVTVRRLGRKSSPGKLEARRAA